MTQEKLNQLILSGGFPRLLLNINSVQQEYRKRLNGIHEQRKKLEVEMRSGDFTSSYCHKETERINTQLERIQREAAAAVEAEAGKFVAAVEEFHKPDGSQLTPSLLNLLQAGILSEEELIQLAAEKVSYPTAYRAIVKASNQRDRWLIPEYEGGDREKSILESYLNGTRALIQDTQDSFMISWSEEILQKAIDQLNRLTVRPQSRPATVEELRSQAAKEAQEEETRKKAQQAKQ